MTELKELKEKVGWILILSGLITTIIFVEVNLSYWALGLLPILVGLMWTTDLFENS